MFVSCEEVDGRRYDSGVEEGWRAVRRHGLYAGRGPMVASAPMFEDIQCASNSTSGVTELTVENLPSCGLGSGRTFRAQVNVTVDGEAQPEQLSNEVSCD